jgi:hypothetical protein
MLVIEFTQLGTSARVSLCVPNLVRIPRPALAGMGRWIGKGRHTDLPTHLPIGIRQTCALGGLEELWTRMPRDICFETPENRNFKLEYLS